MCETTPRARPRELTQLRLYLGGRGGMAQVGRVPPAVTPQRAVSARPGGDGAGLQAQHRPRVAKVSAAVMRQNHRRSSPSHWPCPGRAAAPEKSSSSESQPRPHQQQNPCERVYEPGTDGTSRINAVGTLLHGDFRRKAVMRLSSSETWRM